MRLPAMLCHSAKSLAEVPDGWVMEPKLDGWRWQIVVGDDGVTCYAGRNGSRYDCPPVEEALAHLPAGTILDGELLPVEHGHQSTKVPHLLARGGHGLKFVAFDVLHVIGHDVTGRPWTGRRALLEELMKVVHTGPIELSPAVPLSQATVDEWLAYGYEGAVCKDPTSVYRPGARTRSWVKLKPQQTDDAIVQGFEPGAGKFAGMIGALRLTMVDTGVATTASGMDDATRQRMTDHPEEWIGRRVEIAHHGLHPVSRVPRHPQYKRLREDLEATNDYGMTAVEEPMTEEHEHGQPEYDYGRRLVYKDPPKPRKPREVQAGAWVRNYAAMGTAKLATCIAELNMGEGDAVDRVLAKDGDVALNLQRANAVMAQRREASAA